MLLRFDLYKISTLDRSVLGIGRQIFEEIACQRIVRLTGFPVGTLTIKAANTVDAGSAIEAGGTCAIVDVDAAVGPCPSIHAYARVTTGRIGARGAVVAQRWTNRALVHVQLALRPRVRRWTKTRVFVYPVYAGRPVLAQIPWTVVDVLLAMISAETWKKRKDNSVKNDTNFGKVIRRCVFA